MTIAGAVPVIASWREPEGVTPRGTVIVVPGRGEHAGVYERFGRRISADGYRVWAVADPTVDADRVEGQVRALLEAGPDTETGPHPRVLVGSDAGAVFAAALAAEGLPGVAALALAGLPLEGTGEGLGWEDEVAARTACPVHQARLDGDDALRRGALAAPVPAEWVHRADPTRITVPVLGLHGGADTVAPFAAARQWFASLADAELVSITGGRHDALNDQTHRTAAAALVLFLERIRTGLPRIARWESL
jgi:alpha-beta hydrolase superfamily lysophospholipase